MLDFVIRSSTHCKHLSQVCRLSHRRALRSFLLFSQSSLTETGTTPGATHEAHEQRQTNMPFLSAYLCCAHLVYLCENKSMAVFIVGWKHAGQLSDLSYFYTHLCTMYSVVPCFPKCFWSIFKGNFHRSKNTTIRALYMRIRGLQKHNMHWYDNMDLND